MIHDPLDPAVTEALRAWQVQHSAGIGLSKALELSASVCGGSAREAFQYAARLADQGTGPQELLAALEPILPDGERAVLGAGLRSGRLDDALGAVVRRRELWQATRRAIRARMVLPVLVFVMAVLIAPLPAFILGGSEARYALSVALPLGVAVALWLVFRNLARARLLAARGTGPDGVPAPPTALDRLLLATPVLGRMERLRNLSCFADLLADLQGAGVVMSESLAICAWAAPNGLYREELYRCSRETQAGSTLSSTLQSGSLWPAELIPALAAAEHSGTLEESCRRLARQWEERYTAAVDQAGQWIPRLLYGVVCLFVIYQIAMLAASVAGVYQDALRGVP